MVLQLVARLLLIALFLGACSEVEHESPFDPKSPLLKQARGEVSGRATLENEIDHSQISVVLFNGARRYEATTDKAGDYLFQGVVPGTYQIIANARYFQERKVSVVVPLGERVEAERVTLPSLRAVLTGNALAQVLIDRNFKTEGGVLLKLQRSTSIRGAAPAPAYHTMASDVTLPAIAFQTVSDGDGSWQVAGVPVGRYELTASFDNIPPLTLSDIAVTGDGEVQVDPFVLIPLTGFFDIVGKQDGRDSAEYTTTSTVELRLTGSAAVQRMKIGIKENKDCVYPATPPVLYQAIYPYPLTAEGMNTVCVRFVAATGEETNDLTERINYDGTAPVFYRAEFLAKNGYIDSNTAVMELTAADENSGMRTVQYSLYATGATDAPKDLFQTAIVLPVVNEGPNTFYMRVGDLAGNYAPQMPVTVTLDTTPPVLDGVTINGGAARTSNNNLSLAVATTDSSTTDMQISESSVFSGAAWIPYQSAASYVASTTNGLKSIYVRTRDPLARYSNVVTAAIIYDTTPPADAAVAFASAATSNPVVPVYLSASDNLSAWGTLQARLTGTGLVAVNGVTTAVDAWVNAAAVTNVTFNADGPQTLGVRFRDEVFNETSLVVNTIVVDTVAPVIDQAEFQSSDGYSNDAINILRLTASDDRTGLAYYQIADSVTGLTSAPLEAWRDTLFVPFAVQGLTVRWVRAIDAAGNYGSSVTAWVVYDTVPPVLDGVVLNGGQLRTNDNNLTAAIATSDATVVELQLSESSVFSGAPWIPFANNVSFTGSAPNGMKTVYVRGRDSLNQYSNVVTASIIFDTMPPVDLSVAFSGTATSNAATPIFLSANDNLSAWSAIEVQVTGSTLVAVNGAPANVGQWLAAGTVTGVTLGGDGLHEISARFRDEVGNVSTRVSASLVLDSTLPTIQEAAFDSSGGYTSDPIGILRLTAGDDRSGLSYLQLADSLAGLDSAPLDPFMSTLFVPLDAPGLNTKYVRVVDAAGNYSAAVSASVILDTLPPELVDLTLNAGAQYALSNMLAAASVVTDSSVTEMQVSESSVFSGAPWIPYQTPVSFLVSSTNGIKTVYARVRDPLGQVSNTIARAITLDTQAPYVAQAAFAQAVTSALTTTLTLTAVDNISASGALSMRIQGPGLTTVAGSAANINAWLAYAASVTVTFAGTGNQTVSAEYRDEAGNTTLPAAASTVIDTTGPLSQVTLLSAEGNNRRAQLGWTANADAAYYVVQAMRGVSYNGSFTATEPDQTVTGTSLVFTGLRNNADYTFRVRSYDAVGNPDAAYSNMLTAAVGLVQRAVSWPGTTPEVIDFEIADGVLHVLTHDSQNDTAHMRSADNGATWTRTVLNNDVFHDTGALAATPSALLAVYPDAGEMQFQYSADQGLTFNYYTLPFFDYTQYSYQPGLAADGDLVVFVGAQEVSTGQIQYYVTLSGNGGANQWGWSTPLLLDQPASTIQYYVEAAACVSGPRIRVLYQTTSGFDRILKTGYSKDAGVTWTFGDLDATPGSVFSDFHCQIDARGSTYIMYRRNTNNVLWVEQTEFQYEDSSSVVLPTELPDGSTADFENPQMWVSPAGVLYYAAQDANTETLWLNSIYLGDAGWTDSANWNMREVDNFPTAGSKILVDGEGTADVRIMYEISGANRTRLLTPYLPAPTSFRAILTGDNTVSATWTSLSSLSKFTVMAGTGLNLNGSSFNTDFDTVSYPNAGAYNAVATRDEYGSGEPSVIYRNYPGYETVFGSNPLPNPARVAMSADPYSSEIHLAVVNGTSVWTSRIASATGTVNWTPIATLTAAIEGLDIDVVNGTVWVTYCNTVDGIFVTRSDDGGATFTPPVDLNVYTPGLIGEVCAIAGDIAADYVTVVTPNSNDAWQIFLSGDQGDSFSTFELGPQCETGSFMDADIAIDIKNPNNQVIALRDWGMGECTSVWVTDDAWSGTVQLYGGGLGMLQPRVGVYDGMVYGVGSSVGATTFAIGSVKGTDWAAEVGMDVEAHHVAGVAYGRGQFTAAYITDIGLQLATCSDHCSSPSSWATGSVLAATSTDRAVMAMDTNGLISYGVFGAGAPEVRHWANQGSYTDLPMP